MPELTRANIENLLGAPYCNVLAYDYRAGTMNLREYAGIQRVGWGWILLI